jgi:hypothetical protein
MKWASMKLSLVLQVFCLGLTDSPNSRRRKSERLNSNWNRKEETLNGNDINTHRASVYVRVTAISVLVHGGFTPSPTLNPGLAVSGLREVSASSLSQRE